jgi:hypothetical protein
MFKQGYLGTRTPLRAIRKILPTPCHVSGTATNDDHASAEDSSPRIAHLAALVCAQSATPHSSNVHCGVSVKDRGAEDSRLDVFRVAAQMPKAAVGSNPSQGFDVAVEYRNHVSRTVDVGSLVGEGSTLCCPVTSRSVCLGQQNWARCL